MRARTLQRFSFVVLGCLSIILISPISALQAQEWTPTRTVWVAETGHTIDGYFLDDWREHPDLFGLPITEEAERPTLIIGLPADIRIVQYFEHLAIAYVPEATERDLMVRALPLGHEALLRDLKANRDLKPPEPATCRSSSADKCQAHKRTSFTIAGDFLTYWEDHDGDRLIGAPLTEALETSEGTFTQYFENVVLQQDARQEVVPRPVGKEGATFLRLATSPIPQPLQIPEYDEALFIPPAPSLPAIISNENTVPTSGSDTVQATSGTSVGSSLVGPGPQQGSFKEIVVSISAQSLWAYENSTLVAQTLVSTGTAEVPATVTPVGFYSVHLKYISQTMEGTISNENYRVEDVPWVMYFDYLGNAIHGTYWHSNFGTPMSHGCVNLPLDIAEFLYNWAPEGTAVSVIA
ncbi:L,D-transpeptidase [soil metagenome]